MIAAVQTAGFVLAGGRSSRMGSDKALARFAGEPLIRMALSTMAQAGIAARIAGSRSDLSSFAQQIPDQAADAGPLGGVCAALAFSTARWNVFMPVDMPLLPASLLTALLQRAVITGALVTVATLSGALQPFPVLLDRSVLPAIQQCLSSGLTACYQAWKTIPAELGGCLDAVPVESLRQCGWCEHPLFLPPLYWFQGTNTPAELARLETIASTRIRRDSTKSPGTIMSFE